MAALWGGRFTGAVDPVMVAYNESLSFDWVLYEQDITASIAFARANIDTGILTQEEFDTIKAGLEEIRTEWRSGSFVRKPESDEDIHSANERRLMEMIGPLAGKLHTGRSRNDQVVTDMRMWLRDELMKIEQLLIDLTAVMAKRARAEVDHIMPGFTHLQVAQPVRWSHWLLSHATGLAHQIETLRYVIKSVNRCPLGCGALAGNPFGIDRKKLAMELGFEDVLMNSMNAIGDRDFVLEMVNWACSLLLKLSRLSEDLIIYSSQPYGFVKLADAYSTGSSLMPQKKNPDSLELLRGKAGTVLGKQTGLAATIKGLPTTYNKDLQESWDAMLSTVKITGDSLQIATGVLSTLVINPEKMRKALMPEMLATEIADYLVRKGVPFREGHHVSGRVVALSETSGIPMDELSTEQLLSVDKRLGDDVKQCFNYELAVELKSATGGTSKAAVLEQIQTLGAAVGYEI